MCRVLIRMPADARQRAPEIERLRISFAHWLNIHQRQGRLLVERAGAAGSRLGLGASVSSFLKRSDVCWILRSLLTEGTCCQWPACATAEGFRCTGAKTFA